MITRFVPLLVLLALAAVACGPDKQHATVLSRQEPFPSVEGQVQSDTSILEQPQAEPDTATHGRSTEYLRNIRATVKRLNAVRQWEKVVKRELAGSTEGGEVSYYYTGGQLRKIVARYYGETFQQLTEYYLLPHEELSFIFERYSHYNRPIYYDSITAKKHNDTEAFDLEKSTIEESRSYFWHGRLIHQLDPQDYGVPKDQTYLQLEQKRLQADFTNLLQTLKPPD